MKRLLTFFLTSISLNSFGQENFKKEIDNTYNFHPHELSQAEQQEKNPILDKLFEMVKADTTQYLPLLRQELRSDGHLPYFYYDCAHLLMILSKSYSDKELSAEAFSKCDIRDLDPRIYVILLKSLATDNINITNAAVKILEDTTFHFYLIEHGAFDFMQDYCLMYCLLPLDPYLYVDTLTKYFQQTNDITAQKAIITTLWYSYSCSGDKFLRSLDEGNTVKKEVSEYAQQLLADKKLDKDYKKMLKKIKPDELEEMKTAALTGFSDEAIYDLDFVTKARRQKLTCR